MGKYIVITTLSDDLDCINQIQYKLLNDHLVSGCQVSKVDSTYWWDHKITTSVEYKLEVRTIDSLFLEIESVIRKYHNYKLPEISYVEIKGSDEFLNWISEYTKK